MQYFYSKLKQTWHFNVSYSVTFTLHVQDLSFVLTGGGERGGVTGDRVQFKIAFNLFFLFETACNF